MRPRCCSVTLFVLSIFTLNSSAQLPPTTDPSTQPTKITEQAVIDFLLADLPARDVGNLLYEQSVRNAQLAIAARDRAPWKDELPDEIFLNYVAPHCVINERRDAWRENFFQRFSSLVKSNQTASQTAILLNDGISKLIKIKPNYGRYDASPLETIQAGFASPCGMSILLIDACRSIGIPARLVCAPGFLSVPPKQPTYYFWVEIWDGQWHTLDAGQNTPMDRGWFIDAAAKAEPSVPKACIYAASYKKTFTRFPMIWDEKVTDISAEDVTYSYVKRIPVRLQVIDREDGIHVYGHITVYLRGRLIADADVADPSVFMLSAGQTYDAVVRAIPGPVKRPRVFTAPSERGWLLSLPVGD